MHLGFDADGLDDLPIHSIWVDKWEKGITSERNIAIISIPSAVDKSMAPNGKHVLHAYTPANEPWEYWQDLDYQSKKYKLMKEERCSVFWKPIEKLIPDIHSRIEVKMLGTPITHSKFLNSTDGTYGPAISADKALFPGCKTPIKNLLLCGASTFPGIGLPPVAASGAYAANMIIDKKSKNRIINSLGI